ncbi:MAG TPA: hypothetical protein VKA60_18885 [Blastocatellia bacterium]|nr:hypothetical protein [Blastocatellia bacterium]
MKISKRLLDWRILLVITLAVTVLVATRPASGCGPFLLRQVFTYEKHPDLPLAKFAAGELGVLQPTYARSYLVVAYRYFAGAPLDAAEQKAVSAVWDDRLQQTWDAPDEEWTKVWIDARAKVTNATKPEISVTRSVEKKDLYFNYLNCNAESFKSAAATLNRLIEKYGAASAEAKDWVATQDQVFANCGSAQSLPAAADTSSPVIRANRAYQIAAANFYAGNFDQAEAQFNTIAADASSPWRALAPYLVARTLIRKATLSGGANTVDAATLARAEAQLRRVLADKNESALHASARGLLNYVRLRLAPDERLKELAAGLLKKNAGATFKQDIIDYTRLLDRLVGDDDETEENKKTFDKLPAAIHNDDLSDWALTFQVQDAAALEHAVQRWEKTASTPWLVAALAKISATHPKAAALLEAAGKIKPGSPAFASVSYHTLRLNIEAGRRDEARRVLDALLAANAATLPPSAFNQFMALRMKVATSLDEFLKYAQRVPSGFTFDEDGRELPADTSDYAEKPKKTARDKLSWDEDAASALNEAMPLAVLKEAAVNTTLATHLRRELALATWVRAALLDDDATATALTPAVATLAPELKELLDAYVAAPDKPAKKFAAIYLILKYPGARPNVDAGTGRSVALDKIDDFRDNWWCAYDRAPDPDNPPLKRVTKTTAAPSFLTAAQKAAGSAEWKRLAALGTAPNYLCAQAIKWANLKPDDPRAPEALHLAVRATRYGCTDAQTGVASKQAYDLLHRKYPKSEWAQQTKYWFKG